MLPGTHTPIVKVSIQAIQHVVCLEIKTTANRFMCRDLVAKRTNDWVLGMRERVEMVVHILHRVGTAAMAPPFARRFRSKS